MFIVKSKGEVLRFGVFLILAGLVLWFVLDRIDLWRLSERPLGGALPTSAPLIAAPAGGRQEEATKASAWVESTVQTDERDYFAEYRMERERTRGALGERLKELMESPSAAGEVRKQASAEYLKLTQSAALESQAESLVKARGFEEAIVHLSGESAQVVVKAASVSQQQFLQIVDAVSRITGVKSSAVTVLAKDR